MIDVIALQDAFNGKCIALVTSDDIVRQEMAYNRERKHTMKKRAKKLRLRMSQRSVRVLAEETVARRSACASRSTAYETENAQRPYLTSTHKARYLEMIVSTFEDSVGALSVFNDS